MKHDEVKRAIAKERRKQLSELSHQLKLANLRLMQNACITVNDLLIKYYEKQAGAPLELNTYEQWRERGYQVRKGSISYMVWGKPLNTKKKKEDPDNPDKDKNEEGKEDFFPVCHLFDKSQCYALKADEI